MRTFLYAPDGDGMGAGGGAGSGAPAGAPAPTPNAGSPAGGTLLGGGSSSGTGGAPAPQGAPAGGGTQPAPVVQKSFREGWIGADGKIDKTAYDRLPDHLKPFAETFKKYDTDEAFLGAFAHSIGLNGKKGLMPLPKDASEPDREAWNSRLRELLGVPKDPSGYGVLEKPKDVPDEMWNGEYVQTMAGIMHKYNAPPEMVKALFEADAKFGATAQAKGKDAVAQTYAKAAQEVDQAFGADKPAKLAGAKRAAATLGLDVQDPSVGNNPKVIIALAKMAELLGEDKLVRGGSEGTGPGGLNDRERAKDIVFNKSNPLFEAYHDSSHGGHRQAVAQYQNLLDNWARTQPRVA